MKELKKMLIEWLCKEYSLEEATRDINEAEIRIKGNEIKIMYKGGAEDILNLVTETKEVLIQVK